MQVFYIFIYLYLTSRQIQNCLEEFSQEGYKQDTKFDGDRYGGTYDALLQLIEDVKKDPYHKAKWIKFREAWAAEGQYVLIVFFVDSF